MSPMVIFGLIASVALLAAFALLNLGKLTPEHYTYQVLNFVGAGFLAASAATLAKKRSKTPPLSSPSLRPTRSAAWMPLVPS